MQVEHSRFPLHNHQPGPEAGPAAWAETIIDLLTREQPFLAYDVASRARQLYPMDPRIALLGVLALRHGGSTRRARGELAEALSLPGVASASELLAEIHYLAWEQDGARSSLEQAHALLARLYEEQGAPQTGILAAALARHLGAEEEADALARRVLSAAKAPTSVTEHACRGHVALLLRDTAAATRAYAAAAAAAGADYRPLVAARKQMLLLERGGIPVPPEAETALKLPRVVIFGGQPVDPPGLGEAILPPGKEPALRSAIEAQLSALDARIGYASAACGADLLFAEALLARHGELHVVLPCALEDFIAARVAYAGPAWAERLHAVLERAASVTHATRERYLGHTALLRYANQMVMGLGSLHAERLHAEAYLLAAWDFRADDAPGSPADFIDHWPDIKALRLIQLDELEETAVEAPAVTAPAWAVPSEPQRRIRGMLFADIVGYSKLGEEFLPSVLGVYERIAAAFAQDPQPGEVMETWGDALYLTLPSARDLLRRAFWLRGIFADMDFRALGLPLALEVRIGLHAGPVFEFIHPVTGRASVSGHQVNRAARIEPITIPGEIYASSEFVALLTAEEMAVRHEHHFMGRAYAPWYRAEYLGILDLPKQHGQQAIYHLTPDTAGKEAYSPRVSTQEST